MEGKYFSKPENVLFIHPITRFLAKLFGAKYFIVKCEVCGKIPSDVYGDRCIKHINNQAQRAKN